MLPKLLIDKSIDRPSRQKLPAVSCRRFAAYLRAAGRWFARFRWLVAGPVATIALASVPLKQISPTVYQTEHCLFIIDASIPWSSPTAAYDAIYTPSGGTWPNLASYFDTLTTRFPASYFSICYIANTGASNVPNYIDRIFKATGITTPAASHWYIDSFFPF